MASLVSKKRKTGAAAAVVATATTTSVTVAAEKKDTHERSNEDGKDASTRKCTAGPGATPKYPETYDECLAASIKRMEQCGVVPDTGDHVLIVYVNHTDSLVGVTSFRVPIWDLKMDHIRRLGALHRARCVNSRDGMGQWFNEIKPQWKRHGYQVPYTPHYMGVRATGEGLPQVVITQLYTFEIGSDGSDEE